MLTGKYERFQAVLVSNLCAWWSNVTAVLAIPTGVTPVGWRGETKWKSSLDLKGAKSRIPRLSWKWDLSLTDVALHKCLCLSVICIRRAQTSCSSLFFFNPTPPLLIHTWCSTMGSVSISIQQWSNQIITQHLKLCPDDCCLTRTIDMPLTLQVLQQFSRPQR